MTESLFTSDRPDCGRSCIQNQKHRTATPRHFTPLHATPPNPTPYRNPRSCLQTCSPTLQSDLNPARHLQPSPEIVQRTEGVGGLRELGEEEEEEEDDSEEQWRNKLNYVAEPEAARRQTESCSGFLRDELMEGEKEKRWQQQEEKESNEAEDDRKSDDEADDEEEEEEEESAEGAVLGWQEGYEQDNLGLPIMHWEALSLRIAELEKQEEEKKAKTGATLERVRTPVSWLEDRGRRTDRWEDGNDACNSHVLALTSRLQTQMNLQLCFINNSESEEEEAEEQKNKGGACSNARRGAGVQVHKNSQHPAKPEASKSRGFRSTLRSLRDRLRTDSKSLAAARTEPVVQRKHLERSDLQRLTIKDLKALCSSLSQATQDLSSELVKCLHIRDQLRTEQDAMLLEVQDLTSL
ncbi:schwannomin-interacting protein 1 [Xenentodon cancila]